MVKTHSNPLLERLRYSLQLAGIIVISVIFLSARPAFSGTLSIVSHDRWVSVGRVLDGDTFRTTQGEKIRLLGINTPEIAHTSSPAQPLGYQATNALRHLIAGKTVRLTFDTQRKDAYGRTLAHVYLRNGLWVNGELVRLGMAHVYTFTPNLRRAGRLLALERQARQARLGIWQSGRFKMLNANQVRTAYLGQFRVVKGRITKLRRNHMAFRVGTLNVSIPRKYRAWFRPPPRLHVGDTVVVHGVIRAAPSGLYLALHTPFDLENMSQ